MALETALFEHDYTNWTLTFYIEYYCKLLDMSDDDRKQERQKKSRPILAKIYIMVRRMYRSSEVMANPTMAKAVNYTLN